MLENCTVEYIKGDFAYIRLAKAKECGGCKACLFGKGKIVAPAVMDIECKSGDEVLVQMPQNDILSAPFILYLMPILFLFIGYFVGLLFDSELIQFAFALSFCALSFVLVFFLDKVYKKQRKFMPIIVANSKKTKE